MQTCTIIYMIFYDIIRIYFIMIFTRNHFSCIVSQKHSSVDYTIFVTAWFVVKPCHTRYCCTLFRVSTCAKNGHRDINIGSSLYDAFKWLYDERRVLTHQPRHDFQTVFFTCKLKGRFAIIGFRIQVCAFTQLDVIWQGEVHHALYGRGKVKSSFTE